MLKFYCVMRPSASRPVEPTQKLELAFLNYQTSEGGRVLHCDVPPQSLPSLVHG